jgi:hypothetical protein
MKKCYALLAALLICYSCSNRESECGFEVKIKLNNISKNHSSLEIRVSELVKSNLIKLPPHTNIDSPLCFKNVPNQDGEYFIKVKHKNLDTTVHWGYYTNGIPADKRIYIEILDHDVKVKTID